MASVEMKNVNKVYEGKVTAIQNANLFIQDKEFVVLVGPSGCGKSTLLRMIAGLEEITAGEIYIDGKLVNLVAPKDRDIAMVFQNYALYPHMTVFDNMAFGLKLRKFPKKEIKERVQEAARILDIESYLDRKPKALSGGQRQRVALGRAIVRKPKVFLFDEPLSNLDAKLRIRMRIFIRKIQQEFNITSVYVTHDQEEAMTLSDRIVVMNQGEIEQIGTPQEIYARPRTKFVADFIGKQTNFLTGRVVGTADGRQEVEFWNKTFSFKGYDHLKRGDEVTLVIRPEMIELSAQEGICDGEVTLVTYLGSEVNYEVTTQDQVFAVQVSNPLKQGIFRAGDRVCLNFDLNNIYLVKEQIRQSPTSDYAEEHQTLLPI